jgi:hypothetical protein
MAKTVDAGMKSQLQLGNAEAVVWIRRRVQRAKLWARSSPRSEKRFRDPSTSGRVPASLVRILFTCWAKASGECE